MISSFAKKNWFLIGIVLVIFLASWKPEIGRKGGPLTPEVTVKYGAVFFIFFISGFTLRTEDLTRAVTQVRLHVYIQSFTLLLVPPLLYVVAKLLSYSPFDPWLLNGVVVVGSMPPPVSSAVILTKATGGNEAAAIFNSAFGSFLGIVATPMWLLLLLGSSTSVPFYAIFLQLSATVVLPVLTGQIVRTAYYAKLSRLGIPFGSISSCILLLIIYTTFCDTFSHEEIDIDELSLLSIVLLVILIQLCLMSLTFYLASQPIWSFEPKDIVAAFFCSTHKSLTLGIPILKIVYGGDPQLSVMSIPLLIYHPAQILIGGLLVPTVRGWMSSTTIFRNRRYGLLRTV